MYILNSCIHVYIILTIHFAHVQLWLKVFGSIVNASKTTGVIVFMYFVANECIPCRSSSNCSNIFQILISTKALSPSPRDEHDRTPLYLAAGTGQLDVGRSLISNIQCDPNIRTTERWKTDKFNVAPGRIPLHTAAREGHLNVVQYLVGECGCDVMRRDDDGVTALHLASQQGHLGVVKYLIDEQQADPSNSCLDEKHRTTPLHLASRYGHLRCNQVLNW